MRLAAGIDGGGTGTTLECRDRSGAVVCRQKFGPFNLNSIGEARFSALLEEVCRALEAQGECAALCIGAAGISNPRVAELAAPVLERFGITRWRLVGDHEIALWGAHSGRPGIALIAGTGSVCCGRNAAGAFARAGGWGHLLDDGGSGYALGRDVLAAVVRAWDGRERSTLLTRLVRERLGLSTPQELVAYAYGGDKSRIAAAAPLASEAAGEGDDMALEIYRRAGGELAALVRAVSDRLDLDRGDVALLGGCLTHDRFLRDALRGELGRTAPGLRCIAPRQDAAAGAALMASAMAWPEEGA